MWASDIEPHLKKNALGVSCPTPSQGPRAFEERDAGDHLSLRAQVRVGARFLVKADVQNFYPSVYTHAIPWALHGRATIKKNLAKPRKKRTSYSGDVIDTHVRRAQDGQTMGIPIGPDTSWLLGEILMVAVEQHLNQELGDIRGYRYLDDFEIGCKNAAEAEAVLQVLEEALDIYELSLNPRKVEVIELPDRLEPDGIGELRRWAFSKNPRRQASDATEYFDRLSELRTDDPETSASSFGIARLQGVDFHPVVWKDVQARASAFAVNEPSVLGSLGKLLAAGTARGLAVDSVSLSTMVNEILIRSAPLHRDSEVAWALWFAVEHGLPIATDTCEHLRDIRDSFGVLLALLAEQEGLLECDLEKDAWKETMATDELNGGRWLLSYEAREQGWLQSAGGGDHRLSDPLFSQLAREGVSFLDFSAQTQPSFQVPPSPVPGGYERPG